MLQIVNENEESDKCILNNIQIALSFHTDAVKGIQNFYNNLIKFQNTDALKKQQALKIISNSYKLDFKKIEDATRQLFFNKMSEMKKWDSIFDGPESFIYFLGAESELSCINEVVANISNEKFKFLLKKYAGNKTFHEFLDDFSKKPGILQLIYKKLDGIGGIELKQIFKYEKGTNNENNNIISTKNNGASIKNNDDMLEEFFTIRKIETLGGVFEYLLQDKNKKSFSLQQFTAMINRNFLSEENDFNAHESIQLNNLIKILNSLDLNEKNHFMGSFFSITSENNMRELDKNKLIPMLQKNQAYKNINNLFNKDVVSLETQKILLQILTLMLKKQNVTNNNQSNKWTGSSYKQVFNESIYAEGEILLTLLTKEAELYNGKITFFALALPHLNLLIEKTPNDDILAPLFQALSIDVLALNFDKCKGFLVSLKVRQAAQKTFIEKIDQQTFKNLLTQNTGIFRKSGDNFQVLYQCLNSKCQTTFIMKLFAMKDQTELQSQVVASIKTVALLKGILENPELEQDKKAEIINLLNKEQLKLILNNFSHFKCLQKKEIEINENKEEKIENKRIKIIDDKGNIQKELQGGFLEKASENKLLIEFINSVIIKNKAELTEAAQLQLLGYCQKSQNAVKLLIQHPEVVNRFTSAAQEKFFNDILPEENFKDFKNQHTLKEFTIAAQNKYITVYNKRCKLNELVKTFELFEGFMRLLKKDARLNFVNIFSEQQLFNVLKTLNIHNPVKISLEQRLCNLFDFVELDVAKAIIRKLNENKNFSLELIKNLLVLLGNIGMTIQMIDLEIIKKNTAFVQVDHKAEIIQIIIDQIKLSELALEDLIEILNICKDNETLLNQLMDKITESGNEILSEALTAYAEKNAFFELTKLLEKAPESLQEAIKKLEQNKLKEIFKTGVIDIKDNNLVFEEHNLEGGIQEVKSNMVKNYFKLAPYLFGCQKEEYTPEKFCEALNGFKSSIQLILYFTDLKEQEDVKSSFVKRFEEEYKQIIKEYHEEFKKTFEVMSGFVNKKDPIVASALEDLGSSNITLSKNFEKTCTMFINEIDNGLKVKLVNEEMMQPNPFSFKNKNAFTQFNNIGSSNNEDSALNNLQSSVHNKKN